MPEPAGMESPMVRLMLANTRAGELRREAEGMQTEHGGPGVLRPAASHTGAYLLQALEEQGWTLAPRDESQDPSTNLANVNEAYGLEREENTRLRELLGDVAAAGVAFDDERLGYLEVQIDRETWREIRALEGGSNA